MPTYSYACTECSNRFDVVQAFTDEALTTCDECNGRLRKIFGKVGVVFKGSGFYRNDSREAGKSSSNGSSNGNGQSTSTTSAESGSSDKPATEKPAAAAKAEKADSTASTASAST